MTQTETGEIAYLLKLGKKTSLSLKRFEGLLSRAVSRVWWRANHLQLCLPLLLSSIATAH